jgi:ESCRT-II complex subunit VPS22
MQIFLSNFSEKKFDKYRRLNLQENAFAEMGKQIETFRSNLEEFAREHKSEIKKDPEFRRHFQEMCASIGVDPLASSKGFWSEMLGFGDFYYELSVQIVEVCMAASHRTGGLMEVGELRQRLIRSRGGGPRSSSSSVKNQEISTDDILRAIKKLKILGNGFTLIPLGSDKYLVQSIPGELSMDQTVILQKSETHRGQVSLASLRKDLGWDEDRSQRALDRLLSDGHAWIDHQDHGQPPLYWIPSIFSSQM